MRLSVRRRMRFMCKNAIISLTSNLKVKICTHQYFVAVVKPGRILFEVSGVPIAVAKEALRLAAQKLPVTTKFIVARDFEG